MLKKYLGREKGITGLETAIILIAFVVVAAVFAYTALSAGLFSTQKAQEAVYSGLKEAQSTVELKGSVIATAGVVGGDNGTIKQITFVVSNVLGGDAIDFTQPDAGNHTGKAAGIRNKVVINYIDQSQEVDNLYWTVTKMGSDDGDYLLEPGEKFQITVGGNSSTTGGGNLINALTPDLG
ncbi:MAG: archaellin/type IV pilin N-terminal domain-containing protein, partial [Dehalococcoidales bacterium]